MHDTLITEFELEKAIRFQPTHCNTNILDISILAGREYKDGTQQWSIYLKIPTASSSEIITLDKIRGTKDEAINHAAKLLGLTHHEETNNEH